MPEEHRRPSGRDRSPLDWAREAGLADDVLAVVATELRRRQRRRRWLLGGALVLGLAAIGTGLLRINSPAPIVAVVPSAPRLEILRPRTERLPDGTTLELRDGAEFRADFSGGPRRVALAQGEVFFAIAHDAARPFVVTAAGIDIQAVGTAFSVRRDAESVVVVVAEGRVRVGAPVGKEPSMSSDAASAATADIYLGAGQKLVWPATLSAAAPVVEELSPEQREAAMAWRVPRLELRETPLADVIAAFNVQPGSPRLRLADPALGRLPLSGVLRADNVGVLCRLLEDSYGLEAAPSETDTIIRRKR